MGLMGRHADTVVHGAPGVHDAQRHSSVGLVPVHARSRSLTALPLVITSGGGPDIVFISVIISAKQTAATTAVRSRASTASGYFPSRNRPIARFRCRVTE